MEAIGSFNNRWDIWPAGLDLDTAAAQPYADDEDFLGRNPFHNNWSVFRWDASFASAYHSLRRGEPEVIARKEATYAAARRQALDSLAAIEAAREQFNDPEAYRFLHWRLSENLWHLDAMCACALAWLNAARTLYADDPHEAAQRWTAAQGWLAKIEALHARAQAETARIDWRGVTRHLQRGAYLDLASYVKQFNALWNGA